MLDQGVAVSLILNGLLIRAGIALMGSSQLMVADDLFLGQFLPFRRAKVVLRVDERVS